MNESLSPKLSLDQSVRGAFAELNPEMVGTLATLSPERRFQMVAELADFARASYVAQARMTRPDASPDEVEAMVRKRMLERHDDE